MSTLMKKPLIEEICDNLGTAELKKFASALDSRDGYKAYNLLEGSLPETETPPLVAKATLAIQGPTLVGVYVKYEEAEEDKATPKNGKARAEAEKPTRSYMIAYGEDVRKVGIYVLDEKERTAYLCGQPLFASELRRVISERLQSIDAGDEDAFLKKLKELVGFDGDTVQFADCIEADGDSIFFGGKEFKATKKIESGTVAGTEYRNYVIEFSYLNGNGYKKAFYYQAHYQKGASSAAYQLVNEGIYFSDGSSALRSSYVKTLFGNQSIVGNGNIDLYRHELALAFVDGDTTEIATLEYLSSKKTPINSVTDFNTVVAPTGDMTLSLGGSKAMKYASNVWKIGTIAYDKATDKATFTADGNKLLTAAHELCDVTTI